MHRDFQDSASRLPAGWLDRAENKQLVLAELALRHARRRRHIVGAAASVLVLFAAGGAWFLHSDATPRPRDATAVLTAPERERLPDGSMVERKGDAAYTLQFDEHVRLVVLSRGTAHFEVAKNPARPFVVEAGAVQVRAVGTAFSVEFASDAVEILVTEGKVAVTAPASGAHDLATVPAGASVHVDLTAPEGSAPIVASVPVEVMEKKLAWRVRLVEFSGTTLAEAVKILNRHNVVQFTIADPALAKVKLSGVIRADRTAGVVRLLEDEYGVRVEQRSETEAVLHRAAAN